MFSLVRRNSRIACVFSKISNVLITKETLLIHAEKCMIPHIYSFIFYKRSRYTKKLKKR